MSRIGRLPIALPNGVEVVVNNGVVTVKGKLGELSQAIDACINVSVENNTVTLTRNSEEKEVKAKHGLYRALINNMVVGVSEGFKKTVIAKGVGYRVQKQGNKLVLNIGYSRPVEFDAVVGVNFDVEEKDKVISIIVSGINKELVGQVAAKIRSLRPVEPYHGYGLHYSDEVVIKKEGKKAGKK